jgi:hypothetical protein
MVVVSSHISYGRQQLEVLYVQVWLRGGRVAFLPQQCEILDYDAVLLP